MAQTMQGQLFSREGGGRSSKTVLVVPDGAHEVSDDDEVASALQVQAQDVPVVPTLRLPAHQITAEFVMHLAPQAGFTADGPERPLGATGVHGMVW